jgi:hypothetical protein
MTKILLYGGCHANVLKPLLQRSLVTRSKIDVIINYEIISRCEPFPDDILNNYDYFIFSPINNKEQWNTDRLKKKCEDCGVSTISFPWLQWNGYFPNITKMNYNGNDIWFYKSLMDKASEYDNVDLYISAVMDPDSNIFDVRKNFDETTGRLIEHESNNATDVIVSKYILKNYQRKLLFLTPDHPTRVLYTEVLRQILRKINKVSWPIWISEEPQNEAWTPILPYVSKQLELNFTRTHFRYNGEKPYKLYEFLKKIYIEQTEK